MFKYIDLFAGIGGIRKGFNVFGGECLFTSEWDKYSQTTYKANFKDTHEINGDITAIDERDIPGHDILLAGFPCQPFSIAGVSKKNSMGRTHGFECQTQGTLFFDICRIIKAKQPKSFLLENVKNLKSHDKGNTFKVIEQSLDDLGYDVFHHIIDSGHFLPQHRERIIIVGFRRDLNIDFNFNLDQLPNKNSYKVSDVLHKTDGTEPLITHDDNRFFDHSLQKVHDKYTLSDKLWSFLNKHAEKHKLKGNGFGFGLVKPESNYTRTLTARYYKDGSEILIDQGSELNPRRLTPRECARLMGFSDDFIIPVSNTRAYKQFGNSVAVPVIQHVAKQMLIALKIL